MGEGPGQAPLGYRRDIDGLRAVAVLAVVAFHVGVPGATGGFVGVDVFFAISGFLITSLLAREIARTGSIDLLEFYARRVRRLLPALAVVLLATLILGAVFLSPSGDQQDLARSALVTAAFFSNVHFWRALGDYFAGQAEQMPLLHTWSLAVEEQYYFAWPALLLAIAWLARRRRRPFVPLAVAGLVGLTVISFAAAVWGTRVMPLATFYLTPFRAWEFALGGLLALVPRVPPTRAVATACGALGLAAIALATAAFGPDTAFPGIATLLPVAGALLVIAAGSGPGNPVSALLAAGPCVLLGQLSYSWYLWHWPLLVMARASAFGARAPLRDSGLALLALALAELTRRLVENPIRFGRPAPFRTARKALASGLALSLAMAGCAAWLNHHAMQRDVLATGAGPVNPGCNGFADRATCTVGAWGRVPGVVLWGDSHAGRLSSLLAAFEIEAGVPLLQRTMNACPPLQGVLSTFGDGTPIKICGAFNRKVEQEVGELAGAREARGVVLVGRWANYLGMPSLGGGATRSLAVGGRGLGHAEALAALEEGLAARLTSLEASGLRVLVVAPWPEFPWPPQQCLFERGPAGCSIPRGEAEAERAAALAALREAVRGRDGVRLFDPMDAFCSTASCSPMLGGELVYADRHHLTFRAAASLLPRTRHDLRWLVGLPES